ncbi:MAG: MarC family protein [Candidatus Methylomirabilales bacterium]
MREALLACVALFVAVDILGVLPVYLSLTVGVPVEERKRLPWQATLTATLVGVGFLLIGEPLFRVLGVSVADFQVAGGLLLLALSLHDLLNPGKVLRRPAPAVGAVPLGTPMIVGPAVLTTLVILVQSYGYPITLLAFGLNMGVAFLVLRYAGALGRVLGEAGSRAIGKVASLILAAFGVSLVRRGVLGSLHR